MRSGAAARVWTNRDGIGATGSQTGAPSPGNVSAVGGGFIPTLSMGGGMGISRHSKLVWAAAA
jgi:hypothetical protein